MSIRFSRKTIEEKLVLCQMALKNAQEDEEVKALIAAYNYNESRVSEGVALYAEAELLTREQKAKYTNQFSAREAFYALQKEYGATFEEHYRLAKIAFKTEMSKFNMLGLRTPIKQSYAARIAQAKSFYHNALTHQEIVDALATFAVSQESLENANLLVTKLENAYVAKESAKTEAQLATKFRNEAFKLMQDWMADFLGVCQCAFRLKPELMEKVGILYRSTKYKKKVDPEEEELVLAPVLPLATQMISEG